METISMRETKCFLFTVKKKNHKQNPPFWYDIDKLKTKIKYLYVFLTRGEYNGKTKLIKTNSVITIFRCEKYYLGEIIMYIYFSYITYCV